MAGAGGRVEERRRQVRHDAVVDQGGTRGPAGRPDAAPGQAVAERVRIVEATVGILIEWRIRIGRAFLIRR